MSLARSVLNQSRRRDEGICCGRRQTRALAMNPGQTDQMEPIFGSTGQVVAWRDGEEVLSLTGQYVAFIRNGNVIAYNGSGHIGWFEEGAFWDSSLRAVGILRDTTARLPRPGFGGVPGRPGKAGRPGRPGIPGTPGKPGRSNSWSTESWASWQP